MILKNRKISAYTDSYTKAHTAHECQCSKENQDIHKKIGPTLHYNFTHSHLYKSLVQT